MANRRILIIDDDVAIWKAYQAVLAPEQDNLHASGNRIAQLLESESDISPRTSSEFRLRFAHQGQEGFGLVQEALSERMPYSLAFIDIRMPPGWDGMKTAKKIRKIDPDIEIVIVTAYSDRSREEIVRAVGRSDKLLFLRKPFDVEELYQVALALTEKWTIGQLEKTQRQELETVLDTSPVAIFTVDSNCKILSWNPAAERITGYTAEDVIGHPCIMEKISAKHCNDCLIANNDISDRSVLCHEHIISDRAGRKKFISRKVTFVRDAKGHIVKGVENFWDITAKKEAEQALQNSETRFRSLVETTNDWVWEMDNDGCYTYCSPVCERMYGYLPEELLGRQIFETLLPPDEVAQFELIFNQCVNKNKGFQNIERRSITKDGHILHIESNGSPVVDASGYLTGFRGVDRDITRRKKNAEEKTLLEEQFRQSQKMEVLGTLAGGIAHDFNNVLTPIMLNTQLSMVGLDKDTPLYNHLLDINKSAEKAAALIRQILSFSRKQAQMQHTLNLNAVIADFTKMLGRLVREDIELKVDLAEDLWTINGDNSQIEQILINLVVNARDAIRENGEILIRTYNLETDGLVLENNKKMPISGPYVVLSVADNGTGMEKSTLEQIFNPFYTTKKNGRGTGLGLSLVHGIVSQNDGHIQLATEPGKGSTFYIYFKKSDLPVDTSEEEEIEFVKDGDETILLVEDNMEVRIVTTITLENYGYKVMAAVNGKEAIQQYKNAGGAIDLLLTDVVMPGLGGQAVAEQLRALKPDLPVIFMSGHPYDPATIKLFGKKNISFMQKPFYPQNMAKKVRELLDTAKVKNTTEGTEV
jgi:PAS domain S-box-containing protein